MSSSSLGRGAWTHVEVPLKTHSRLCLRVSRVDTALLLESVTLVPAVTMFRPRSHTDPTELPFALLACHMAEVSSARSAPEDKLTCIRRSSQWSTDTSGTLSYWPAASSMSPNRLRTFSPIA